jgi:hypothetical protein
MRFVRSIELTVGALLLAAVQGLAQPRLPATPGDFNGDGKAEFAVAHPTSGVWHVQGSPDISTGLGVGVVRVPADYDGDGKLEPVLFHASEGYWSWYRGYTFWHFDWGQADDRPVPADYNGDGKAEHAVFRPFDGRWFICTNPAAYCSGFVESGNSIVIVWGQPADIPVPADYNGDGKAEVAVFRPGSGTWYVEGLASCAGCAEGSVQWGQAGDIPVPADYNGDGTVEMAFYRPTAGGSLWSVRGVGSWVFGSESDFPLPQDVDGDGRAELVVYRRSTATWYTYFPLTGATETTQFGSPGDIPVLLPSYYQLRDRAGDVDGDGRRDLTIFRPSDGMWWTLLSATDYSAWDTSTWTSARLGRPGDIPVGVDFSGDRRMDVAVYRPSTGYWYDLKGAVRAGGLAGDVVVPAEYTGDGSADIGIFRQEAGSVGTWYVSYSLCVGSSTRSCSLYPAFTEGHTSSWPAEPGDLPVPADYDGDGRTDLALFRPADGSWHLRLSWADGMDSPVSRTVTWGTRSDDIPVPDDYDGDGRADIAIYRPSDGAWWILYSASDYTTCFGVLWGTLEGDIPVPGDYDGDGRADIAIYRPSDGMWWLLFSASGYTTWQGVRWGTLPGDIPVPHR